MTDAEKKEAYLNSPEAVPGQALPFPTPYRWHLDEMVTKVIGSVKGGVYEGVEFNLFNRWEAEYIQEQMEKRCPDIEFRMKWHFGGPMKDDGDKKDDKTESDYGPQ